jgi:phosphomannomutase
MRDHDAVYGGEMSAHHYFRDFAYCDSGMIPWLLVVELLSVSGKPLSELVAERQAAYPVSGEINRSVVSMEFAQWRFNVRMSNTEPLVRLNVESRGDQTLMQVKTAEILAMIEA